MHTASNPATDLRGAQAFRNVFSRKSTKAQWIRFLGAVVGILLFASVAAAQRKASPPLLPPLPVFPSATLRLSGSQTQPHEESPGSISGSLVAEGGSPVSGAQVALTRGFQSPVRRAVSSNAGTFSFSNVGAGPFELIVTADPFGTKTYSGVLKAGQKLVVPPITLVLQTVTTTVVVAPPEVIAQRQVKAEEHQRVFGFVPNFYVTYSAHPVPLDFKQKLNLAWKSVKDPITLLAIAGASGFAQERNWYSSYGQGAQGYGKRFAATYGTAAIGTFLDSVIMPTIFRQDPRYIYKGKGSWGSRLFYALSRSVMEKGDNGHWQPNYSAFFGSLATSGIADSYHPARDRTVGFAFEVAGARMAEVALANVFEEFFSRKLTPSLLSPHRSPERAVPAGKRQARHFSKTTRRGSSNEAQRSNGSG